MVFIGSKDCLDERTDLTERLQSYFLGKIYYFSKISD